MKAKPPTSEAAFAPRSTVRRKIWPAIHVNFPLYSINIHRARLKVFPYALLFVIEADMLLVIACFHSSRDPQRWQQRV